MEEPYAYVHTLPSLDAYPRVRFFYRNFNSLVPRFKRVAGSLPTCFHDISLNKELDDTLDLMKSGIHVTVFGHEDIDRNTFVISTSGQETGNVEIFPKIDVCYVKTNGVAHSNVEEVWSLIDRWIKRGRNTNWNLMFLCCEITTLPSNRDVENFKSAILKELLGHGIKLLQSNITVSTHVDVNIAEHISNFLEAFVIQGFVKINNHLDRFVLDRLSTAQDGCPIKQKSITKLFKDILTAPTLEDLGSIHFDTNAKQDNQSAMKKNQNIVLAIPRVVKCLLVPTLAQRFSMSAHDCNSLICYTNFEKKLYDAIKLEPKQIVTDICKYITSTVDNVLPGLISEIESEFQRTKRVIVVMRKMKYEVHGYLKQTNVSLNCKPRPVAPKIPDELREAIQSVKGVYGLGTFYGQIEIHLDSSTTLRDTMTEHNIKHLMHKYRFCHPYLIKHVTREPKAMLFNLDPGTELLVLAKNKNGGTLGGYITDEDKKVYALTCAHVVEDSNDAKVFVIIKGGKHPLSRMQSCFLRGHCDDFRFVDIAAVHVLDKLQKESFDYLRDPRSPIQQVSVINQIPEELVGCKVSKIGAFSGKTYGIIGAVDQGMFGCKAGEYLVPIDPLPGDELGYSADEGASGASQLRARNYPDTGTGNDKICLYDICKQFKQREHLTDSQSNEPFAESLTSRMGTDDGGFKVYVPNPNTFDDKDVVSGLFAKRGDSGSIVCTNELVGHYEEYTAISMVSAGEFATRHQDHEDNEDKNICLSFKLQVGLEKLQEYQNIRW